MGLLNDYLPDWLPSDPNQADATRQGLLSFGAALLGGRGNLGQIMGQGISAGSNGYQGALQNQGIDALRAAQLKGLNLQNQGMQGAMDQQKGILQLLNGSGPPASAPAAPSAASQLTGAVPSAVAPLSSLPQMSSVSGAPPSGPMSATSLLPQVAQPDQSNQDAAPADGGLSATPQASAPGQFITPPVSAPDSSITSLPQVGAAPQNNALTSYQSAMAQAQLIQSKFGAGAAKPYFEAAKSMKPDAKDIKTVTLPDGSRVLAQFFSDGSPPQIVQGIGPDKEKLVGYGAGGSYNFADPFSGKTMNSTTMTATPDAVMSNATTIRGQNMVDARAKATADSQDPATTPFMRELASMYPKGSPEYDEALRQRINKQAGINAGGGGGRSVVYNGRIIASGNEVAQALRNIADLPVQSNAGFMGMGKPESTGLFSASIAGLKHEMNSDQVKTYNTMWTGVSRNLGTLETSGLATTGDLIKSIDKLQFVPGDNGYNALRKLAEVRQIIEAALEPKLHDPAVPGQQREYIKGVIDAVHAAVPYTHADLTRYDRAAQKNPALTLQDFAGQTVNKGKVAPVSALPQVATPAPVAITGSADYATLPSGTLYTAPDGHTRRKP